MNKNWFSNPLNQRRWQNFKANKRGYYSFWLFLVLFTLTLFAEVIANDKPLVVYFDGGIYLPVFKVYPETAFGGDFETRNRLPPGLCERTDRSKGVDVLASDPLQLRYD